MKIAAPNITRKVHNLLTNKVEVDYTFMLRDELIQKTEVFANIYTANTVIDKNQREWFLACLENFVNHKKHIIEAGHPDQLKELELCTNAKIRYEALALPTIAANFLKGYEHFVKILPSHLNPSYKNSYHNLLELKSFCENYLKQQP